MIRQRLREATLLDRVYDHVVLPPIILQAVDTPAFQRLRSLKQLGASSYLYPGAVHTRFEHSIGVAHMARQLLANVQRRQPDMGITDDDVHKAMLAGLLHDVGHGPFSHLFEDVVARRCGAPFDHEDMSERIARRVLRELISHDDVEEVIRLMRGRSTAKYGEIISNKNSGIDVDRIDYFIRDSLCCFGKPTVDVRVNRLFNSARFVCDDGHWHLAFEEKLALSLRELFALRAKLHKNVYQHQVVKAVGHMIGDAIHLAAPHFTVGGRTIMECAADDEHFLRLGDWVLEAIESQTDNPLLRPAQEIIARLRYRDLYRVAFVRALRTETKEGKEKEEKEKEKEEKEKGGGGEESFNLSADWMSQFAEGVVAHAAPSNRIAADDFIVDVVVIHYGKGQKDPLRGVLFYNPKRPSQPPMRISSDACHSPLFTPFAFEEKTLVVFERRHTNGAVREACEKLAASDAYKDVFVDALPFHNQS